MNAKGWKKPLLVVLATAPIGFAIFAFVFMAQYERAFDESRCPYEELETRAIAEGVAVREDRRVCQDDIEEHRWVILRDGRRELELGRRPLERHYYRGAYRWTAQESDGRVRIEIENPGLDMRAFREPHPDAGLTD